MKNQQQNSKEFQYVYSAKEQAELQKIREKYVPKEEDKMELLRRMDARVTQKATVVSLIFGVLCALLLGFGMSLCMTDLPMFFGLDDRTAMIVGISFGIVGMVGICLAYPIYHRISVHERKKIAPEILRLTDELMK